METLMEMPLELPLELPRTVQQAKARPAQTARWYALCRLDELEDSWGEAVLINGQQLALFRVGASQVFAVSHADPATRSHVMARGLVGSRGDVPTIASPLHKEVYSLATGECFGHPELHLGTYPVRVVDGAIEVSLDMCR
ncbi:nitrite reductase small subunit NirD [Specibacter sp. NPDC057265]|uniref:nitrite reductase small subunit NirD n=1 Tax=Specibacter sp. NPDC057265 TaxID=3346075 RepID=UPI003630275E